MFLFQPQLFDQKISNMLGVVFRFVVTAGAAIYTPRIFGEFMLP
jgi:hypothetical protein